MRTIRVLFLRATPDDHWINRAVSYLDPPFCHVEVEFEMQGLGHMMPRESCDGQLLSLVADDARKPRTLASSIYSGESVFLKERTFSNPNYTILTLNVPDASFNRMLRFAQRAAQGGRQFSSADMLCTLCPFGCNRLYSSSTFCSAYITELLQEGSIDAVTRLSPKRMRPSTLYKVLHKATQQSFSTVPFKIQLMESTSMLRL